MKQFDEIIMKIDLVIEKVNNFKSVCICGSSKFSELIAVVKWELEKNGIMATGLHLLPEWYVENKNLENHHIAEQQNVANILDELHLRKIDASDCVIIVNYDDYIGERTKIEIEYALNNEKTIYYYQ